MNITFQNRSKRWLYTAVVAFVLALSVAPTSMLLDELAGTSIVSSVMADDEVSDGTGG